MKWSNVLSIRFMTKLDNEVSWYSEDSKYPRMIRRSLMELNRSVCIRFPEFNLPWMHEAYVILC